MFSLARGRQLVYLPPPWGDCKATPIESDFFTNYSITACRLDCETRYLAENCNCRMVHMPGEPGMGPGPGLGPGRGCCGAGAVGRCSCPCDCCLPRRQRQRLHPGAVQGVRRPRTGYVPVAPCPPWPPAQPRCLWCLQPGPGSHPGGRHPWAPPASPPGPFAPPSPPARLHRCEHGTGVPVPWPGRGGSLLSLPAQTPDTQVWAPCCMLPAALTARLCCAAGTRHHPGFGQGPGSILAAARPSVLAGVTAPRSQWSPSHAPPQTSW